MADDELIKHIFDDLKEIKEGVNKLCDISSSHGERIAKLEENNINNVRNTNIKYNSLNIVLSSCISVIAIIASKVSGLLH